MRNAEHIEIRTTEYRPCYVTEAVAYSDGIPVMKHERKALFHRWAEQQTAIIKAQGKFHTYPSKVLEMAKQEYERGVLLPGFDVDVHYCTVAIVELEDGRVVEVAPDCVRFVPGLMNEYDFMEAVNETRT